MIEPEAGLVGVAETVVDDEADSDGVAGRDAVPVSELVANPEPVCDAGTANDDDPVGDEVAGSDAVPVKEAVCDADPL